ncbi:transcription regulator [Streptococcus criceti]|uniref:Organic hydroperoxide resistance transcriptional regulator n=1 Tax=Streptococcus criceti HS-6 TaxID=873449 RepID=G5JP18_STRCG|nr:MarR family winged helix-turn-helix transcriptional regulator [Streptococcus criceti]EHI73642.1 organic hydroperoxide resistance transcriptional regulator [Streptococcus criceti HS-6]SUN43427.1 transcription regulator [Streptococcus criceti]
MPHTAIDEHAMENPPSLLLENNLCFSLYVTSREFINRYTPLLAGIGLTYTQYVTMMVLWQEKQILTKDLRAKLFLDSGTLTPVLKKLEDKKLITKERSKMDARDVIVTITADGLALEEEALGVQAEVAKSFEGMEAAGHLMASLQDMMAFFRAQRKEN